MKRSVPVLSSGNCDPSFTMMISSKVAPSVKLIIIRCLDHLGMFILSFPKYLTYRILRQMRKTSPTVFDRTVPITFSRKSVSKDSFASSMIINNRMRKMPLAPSSIHLIYELDKTLPLVVLCRKIFVMATMLHPNTSVVTAVDKAWMSRGDLKICSRMLAPTVPIRYPMMFPAIINAAVNSILICFL